MPERRPSHTLRNRGPPLRIACTFASFISVSPAVSVQLFFFALAFICSEPPSSSDLCLSLHSFDISFPSAIAPLLPRSFDLPRIRSIHISIDSHGRFTNSHSLPVSSCATTICPLESNSLPIASSTFLERPVITVPPIRATLDRHPQRYCNAVYYTRSRLLSTVPPTYSTTPALGSWPHVHVSHPRRDPIWPLTPWK